MPLNRRDFLRNSSLIVLGSTVLSKLVSAESLPWPPGLQSWTLGDLCRRDLPGTLKKLSAMGYKDIEFAGYYGHTIAEIKSMLADNGLRSTSLHFTSNSGNHGRAQWPKFCNDVAEIGATYATFPMFHPMLQAGQFGKAVDTLNALAKQADTGGVKFAYHNHNYEFRPQGKEPGYDYILKNTDAALVNMELDCYWMVQAGYDPVQYMNQYPGRFALIHVKDRLPGFPTSTDLGIAALHTTAVGKGSINWVPIFQAAEKAGVKQYYVEQENNFMRSKFDSVKASVDYLKQLQI